jgi:adenylosuccinate synthase
VSDRSAILVVDLAFGDCGKGTIVDYLVRTRAAHTVVRFNGGPQAGHNVVAPDGRHHTFAQFGSGTLVAGVRTLLSHFTLVEPYAMINEATHLRDACGVGDALARTTLDRRCIVITPPQQAANRLREIARGAAAHGTCGMGVGEAVRDSIDYPELVLRAGELSNRAVVTAKLRAHRRIKLEQVRDCADALDVHAKAKMSLQTLRDDSWVDAAADNYAWLAEHVTLADERVVAALLNGSRTVVFEGAQGVLLDEAFGFHPHTTWSTTTLANADALLDEAGFDGLRVRLGVLRSYFTRHGAGPLVSEDPSLGSRLPEPHNDTRGWQGAFRVGPFDAVAARYALAVAGPVDGLALTHLDRWPALDGQVCDAYDLVAGRSGSEDAYFDFDGARVRGIRPGASADNARQQRLTDLLSACTPIIKRIAPGDTGELIDFVEDRTRSAVAIESWGPTSGDKRVTARCPVALRPRA